MNEKIKEEWIALLRYADIPQGQKYLCRKDKLCCLGVLSEMAVAEGIIESELLAFSTLYDGCSVSLPFKVMKWAGFKDTSMAYIQELDRTLASLNDSGKTFPEIADIIEEYL